MDRSVQISGKKLAALRKTRYMTQAEFGSALGIGNSRVAQIEASDDVGVYLKNFRKLAAALGMKTDELLGIVGVGSDTVTITLPRAIYDSIASRAARRGLSVEEFIAKVGVEKTFRIREPIPPDPSPVTLPVPGGSGTTGKSARRRANAPAQ